MKPRMEKIAKPAMKLVPLLRRQRARQSLQGADGEKEAKGSHSFSSSHSLSPHRGFRAPC